MRLLVRFLVGSSVFLLPSCGLFGSEGGVSIPVSEAQNLGNWTATNIPLFDYLA